LSDYIAASTEKRYGAGFKLIDAHRSARNETFDCPLRRLSRLQYRMIWLITCGWCRRKSGADPKRGHYHTIRASPSEQWAEGS